MLRRTTIFIALRGVHTASAARCYSSATHTPGEVLLRRYEDLVGSSRLQSDQQQLTCLRHFQRLLDELAMYSPRLAAYEHENQLYQAERKRKREQLLAEERRQAQRLDEKRAGFLEQVWSAWRVGRAQDDMTPMQKSIAQARARELRLDDMLGPPPTPPVVPKGIYLHGSVGSGKTMVMDLACAVMQELQLVPKLRRVHFSRAFDELHQRMHRLEQARAQLSDQEMHRFAESVATQERGALSAASSSDVDGSNPSNLVDPVVRKQKAFHQAKLAMRRLRAQAERKRKSDAPIGNSLILAKAALSLIRGGADVDLGWQEEAAHTASVLCFDEMQIGDPFAAIALKGVFEALMEYGTVIVCTSNLAPWDLNPHGIAEDLFDEFSASLMRAVEPVELSAERDYRRLSHASQVGKGEWLPGQKYHTPLDGSTAAAMERAWQELLWQDGCARETSMNLPVMYGRSLEVRRAGHSVACFDFDDICGHPLGPADYFAVAQAFHTVIITNVPNFSLQMRDRARRFISLLDELYNARTQLVISAASPPHLLFQRPGDVPVLDLEGLQFETAVEGSRLRRDLTRDGGVAPLASSTQSLAATTAQQSGLGEAFAFARAVSRLYELTSWDGREAPVRSAA